MQRTRFCALLLLLFCASLTAHDIPLNPVLFRYNGLLSKYHTTAEETANDGVVSKIYLWKVTHETRPGTVYLYGSIHVPLSWIKEHVPKVNFDQLTSDTAITATEIAFTQHVLDEINQCSQFNGTANAEAFLGAELYQEYSAAWTEACGPLPEKFNTTHPAFFTTQIMLCKKFGGIVGSMDGELFSLGTADGDEVIGLEEASHQCDALLKTTDENTKKAVESVVATDGEAEAAFNSLLGWYAAGDDASLIQQSQGGDALDINKRNLIQLDGIKDILTKDKKSLVIVGALHTIGENGLVKLLQTEGFTVERQTSYGDPPAGANDTGAAVSTTISTTLMLAWFCMVLFYW